MLTFALLAALTPDAHAAERETPAETPEATTEAPASVHQRPMYVSSRASMAVPLGGQGDARTAGLGFGVDFENGHQLGMRAIWLPDPPATPLFDVADGVEHAWGPVLDWRFHLLDESTLSPFFAGSAGFVFGAASGERGQNLVLPILEGGAGLRLSKSTRSGARLFAAPEIGVVPAALAPYAALNLGVVLPGGR